MDADLAARLADVATTAACAHCQACREIATAAADHLLDLALARREVACS